MPPRDGAAVVNSTERRRHRGLSLQNGREQEKDCYGGEGVRMRIEGKMETLIN